MLFVLFSWFLSLLFGIFFRDAVMTVLDIVLRQCMTDKEIR